MANATITESELSELRTKFQLLEGDRKAYYEISMHTMKENKQKIGQLRGENKELRKSLANAQREAGRAMKAAGVASNEDISDLERHVALLRKNYDTMKCTVEKKRGQLQKLKDRACELELEAQRPNADGSPLTRKIRMLENRLDKAMIKYNEAQSIRKTYEQIVKRLREERVGFDNQLGAIERTLAAKQHDYEELLLLSGDANHAKEVSLQDLERVKSSLDGQRKQRSRDLEDRREVAMKTTMADRTEQRENMRRDMIAKAQGDLSAEEEQNLKKSMALNVMTQGKIKEEGKVQRAKIDVYEDAFRKIKEATGVADVNEVIQKFVSQEDTQNNLMDLTKENQVKLDGLNEDRGRLKARVEEIKYSGTGGGHKRKMVDDHEEGFAVAQTKLERARIKYERMAKILINVKAGVDHLSDKLEHVREDGKTIVMNNDTIADVLYMCEQALVNILTKMRDAEAEDGTDYTSAAAGAFGGEISNMAALANRPYNQRVALPSGDDAGDYDLGDMDDLGDDDGDEELSRARIKKAAQGIVASHERKGKKKRRGGGREEGGTTGGKHKSRARKARPV